MELTYIPTSIVQFQIPKIPNIDQQANTEIRLHGFCLYRMLCISSVFTVKRWLSVRLWRLSVTIRYCIVCVNYCRHSSHLIAGSPQILVLTDRTKSRVYATMWRPSVVYLSVVCNVWMMCLAVLGMILLNCIVILILILGSKLYHDTDTWYIYQNVSWYWYILKVSWFLVLCWYFWKTSANPKVEAKDTITQKCMHNNTNNLTYSLRQK